MIDAYFGELTFSKLDITINKEGDIANIPTFKDVWPKSQFALQSLMSRGNFRLNLTRMCQYSNVVIKQDDWFIITPLTKYFDALIQRSFLLEQKKQPYITDLGKRRVDEEIAQIDKYISNAESTSILASNIVISAFRLRGSEVDVISSDPIIALLYGSATAELRVFPSTPNIYDISSNEVGNINSLIDAELAKVGATYKPIDIFCFTVNLASAPINLSSKVVNFLIQNRHKLMSCADILYNSISPAFEYSMEELSSRSITLYHKLNEMSRKYPTKDDAVHISEIPTSFSQLCNLMGYSISSNINDYDTVNIIDGSPSIRSAVTSLTILQVALLCCLASKIVYDDGSITITIGTSFLKIARHPNLYPEDDFDSVLEVLKGIMCTTLCPIEINNADGVYQTELKYVVQRLSRGFRVSDAS